MKTNSKEFYQKEGISCRILALRQTSNTANYEHFKCLEMPQQKTVHLKLGKGALPADKAVDLSKS